MITCGIEIDNNRAIIVCLEKYKDGTIEICEHSTKIVLDNHENSNSVKEFNDLIHSQLDTISPIKIGIVKRQIKGPYAAGGLSFKIESLIQCYKGTKVVLVPLPTIKTYLKKNPRTINPKYKYQENGFNTAYYLMKK